MESIMRTITFFFIASLYLSACGSTTVVDGGSNSEIPTDVAADATTDVEDTAATDTAVEGPDTTGWHDTYGDGGPPGCNDAGCPCEGPDSCAETLVCAAGLCCQPACGEKVCGDDGCGGSCGECDGEWGCNQYGACMICEPGVSVCIGNSTTTCNTAGDGYSGVPFECGDIVETPVCQDGACVCAPDCDGKVCGDDGCGGSCGECEDAGAVCSAGQCGCAPQCEGLQCGDDGCGGSCGECDSGVCNGGLCESPAFPLGDACENPYEIDKLPFNVQASTVLSDDNEQVECLAVDEKFTVGNGRDEVYSVEITEDGELTAGFSTWSDLGEPDWPLLVYMQTSCVKGCTEYMKVAIEQTSTILKMPVQQGQTVFIVVDGLAWGDEGTYNLNVQFTP
jgi:hypothetical protein